MSDEQSACTKCGDCCDPVVMDSASWRLVQDPDVKGDSADFIRTHWREVETVDSTAFLRCDRFDSERRLCMAHDTRPPVCRDYPWYGGRPNERTLRRYPRCGYWVEVALAGIA